jgi:5-(carboxyamino)imidazole ribonucleotide mutase
MTSSPNDSARPLVGILMGSDSDLDVMREAAKALDEFEVSQEMRVISAHRTPEDLSDYARGARERGMKVIIAGAGGAAHLPGVCAAFTTLPVIGVPVLGKSLAGADSLYSIVQMPPGIPVATVGIGNARNAGLLAVAILAVADERLAARLDEFRRQLAEQSRAKNRNLDKAQP